MQSKANIYLFGMRKDHNRQQMFLNRKFKMQSKANIYLFGMWNDYNCQAKVYQPSYRFSTLLLYPLHWYSKTNVFLLVEREIPLL